jgi:poly(A) polymerase
MLQCHPYPNEYIDASKQCPHCAFFMGLQRKEGVTGQEGQQFDIRGTVDEFRQEINMYMFWKPGMEIYVSHVRRRQLPGFVFPDGYKRSRSSRHINQHTSKTGEDVARSQSGSAERPVKRKNDCEMEDLKPEKQACYSPVRPQSVSPSSSVSRSGVTSLASSWEGVKLGCSTIREIGSNCKDVASNSEVRSSSGQLESEKDGLGDSMQLGETVYQDSPLNRQISMDVHDSPIVRNELEPANHMNGIEPMESMVNTITKQEMLSPQEIPNFETGEKHETGVNDKIAGLGSNLMENGSSRKLLNWVAGTSQAMEVDQELVKPCCQTAVVEYADSVIRSHSGTQNLNCEVSYSV